MVTALLRRGSSGVTMRKLRQRPQGIDLGPLRPGALPGRLQTRSGRLELAPPVVLADLARLAATRPAEGLVLIGRRHQQDCNSWMHNTERLTRGRPRHQLYIHPDDLAAAGAADGDVVRVASVVGQVDVEARANPDMMRGVVSLPHGYGHGRDGVLMARSAKTPGVCVNDLTDPARLDVSGNAALNGVPVTVSPSP
jgi:anaerobic selenocysteine-containing dehydrogenase